MARHPPTRPRTGPLANAEDGAARVSAAVVPIFGRGRRHGGGLALDDGKPVQSGLRDAGRPAGRCAVLGRPADA